MTSNKLLLKLAAKANVFNSLLLIVGVVTLPAKVQAEQAHSANSFIDSIGVNTHLTYTDTAYGDYEGTIKPRLRESGIKHIRDGGFYDQNYFNKLKDLSQYGIKLAVQFYGTPVGEAVGIAKNELSGVVEIIEGPNEPDISASGNFSYNGMGFPEGVRDYQNDLYNAVKADSATASLPVLLPSMGWGENAERMGHLDSGDIGNMHSYANLGNQPTDAIDWYFIPHVRRIAGGSKPLMSTETGYHNLTSDALGVSENAAGKYIPRILLENFNRDIKRTYLYELIDQHPDSGNSNKELHFGLLRSDGSPKPAFTAVKNLIALLQESGNSSFTPKNLDYKLSGDTQDVQHTLLQKSNGTFYLILWQDVKSWDSGSKQDIANAPKSVTVEVDTAVNKATVYNPNISTDAVAEHQKQGGDRLSQFTVEVPDYPLVVELN